MIVDMHVHLAGSVTTADQVRSGADALLTAMNEAGIQKAVVQNLSSSMSNEFLLAECAAYPDRLIPFVLAYPDSPELSRIPQYKASGARGIGEMYVRPGSKEGLITYLAPILTVARENQLPVLFHTGEFSYTAPILTAEVIRTNPDITFILGHMGSMAYVLDTIEILKTFPNAYADTSGLSSPLMLRRAVEECGAEKLLFASDYPFWHPRVELQRIYAAKLGKKAERMILSENAARLLRL